MNKSKILSLAFIMIFVTGAPCAWSGYARVNQSKSIEPEELVLSILSGWMAFVYLFPWF